MAVPDSPQRATDACDQPHPPPPPRNAHAPATAAPEPSARDLFEVLVREHGNALLASIHAIAGPSHADDIFQDTVLVAWRRLGDYDRTRLRLPPP